MIFPNNNVRDERRIKKRKRGKKSEEWKKSVNNLEEFILVPIDNIWAHQVCNIISECWSDSLYFNSNEIDMLFFTRYVNRFLPIIIDLLVHNYRVMVSR